MRLPALAIAAAFACGIALGLCPPLASRSASQAFFLDGFVVAGCFILPGIVLTQTGHLLLGAGASMLSWALLGILGAGIAQQPVPANHVTTLVDGGRIDLRTPLRWHGKLRDEPARLPWGYG